MCSPAIEFASSLVAALSPHYKETYIDTNGRQSRRRRRRSPQSDGVLGVATSSLIPTRQGHVQVFGPKGTDSMPLQRPATGASPTRGRRAYVRVRPRHSARGPPDPTGGQPLAARGAHRAPHNFFPFRPAKPLYLFSLGFPWAKGPCSRPWPAELGMQHPRHSIIRRSYQSVPPPASMIYWTCQK